MFFFTSDPHFNNPETIINDNRPFKNPKSFDKTILKLWNKQAKKRRHNLCCWRFLDCDNQTCLDWEKAITYPKKLKADVVLILGNNEKRIIKYFFNDDFNAFREHCIASGFKEVYETHQLEMLGQTFYLTHKPIDYKKGMLNIFGHMHRGGGIYKPFGFNVGCDLNHFRLYSEKDIAHLIKMKELYWDSDTNINMRGAN